MSTAPMPTTMTRGLGPFENSSAPNAAKAAVACPEGNDEPWGRSTIMGTSGFTSHGRGRMIRGFRMPLVIMAPMRTATRTAAPSLRVFGMMASTMPSRIQIWPTSLVLV